MRKIFREIESFFRIYNRDKLFLFGGIRGFMEELVFVGFEKLVNFGCMEREWKNILGEGISVIKYR